MKQDLQALFDKALSLSGVAGAQLSVFRDGEQLNFCGGCANAELRIPMTPDTVVQIGSITKVMNAMLIMRLREQGVLELDTPVQHYLPDFSDADPLASASITLRHLLSMSSGMDNGDYSEHGSGEDAIARRVASLRAAPHHFEPGKHFGYSNASTDVSGFVAERVTGKWWDDLLREHVLEPIGLRNTVSRDWERLFQRTAVGHAKDARVIRHPRWSMPRGTAPMGGVVTASAQDLVRLGRVFLNRGRAESGTQVLPEESIQLMTTPQIDVPVHSIATAWCLGPCTFAWDGVQMWGHPGGNISGGALLQWIPSLNAALAWTINTVSAREPFEKVMQTEVMQRAFGVSKPDIRPPVMPVSFDPSRYTGTYAALDGELVVSARPRGLHVEKRWRYFADPSIVDTESFELIPLGPDYFLIDRGAATDPLALPHDCAFFGVDNQGRATNVLNYVWAMSRRC